MCNMWKKVFAVCLSLAMVMALLPVSALHAEAAVNDLTEEGIVLFEDNFEYTDAAAAAAAGWTNGGNTGKIVFDGEAMKIPVTTLASNTNVYFDYSVADLGIAGTHSTMTVKLQLEFRVSAPLGQYIVQNQGSTALDGTTTSMTRAGASNVATTASAEYETCVQTYTLGQTGALNSLNIFKFRIGGYKTSGITATADDYVCFDYVKVTLLPAEGSYFSTQMKNVVSGNYAYAKLPSDITMPANTSEKDYSLVLGNNAVLDLNGHTLTLGEGQSITAGANAVIIDSSANKSGKLVVGKDNMVLTNPGNPQLPVWTGDGYIFTEPELGDTRAFFVDGSESADGFILDFRPGFGEAGGVNVRESYLAGGNSGITMDAKLSWNDIYGAPGDYDLVCDTIFNGMYATPTARGRLQLTGAEKYESVSLTISLASCGVVKTFAPVTFTNTYTDTLFAADFESGAFESNVTDVNTGSWKTFSAETAFSDGALQVCGTNVLTLDQAIATGTGKTLVLEFDLTTDNGGDKIAIRASKDSKYVNLLGTNKHAGNATAYAKNFYMANNAFTTGTETVAVRMEIDLGTGNWIVKLNGGTLSSGQYADFEAVLNGQTSLYVHEDNTAVHYIDNMLVYTITAPSAQ